MKKSFFLFVMIVFLLSNSILLAFTISEEFNVIIQVHQYAIIDTPAELNIYLFDDNQETNLDSDEFSIRTNFALSLDIESGGFNPLILNEYIRYYVDGAEIVPGTTGSAILSMEEGTYLTSLFSVELDEEELINNEEWEYIAATTVSDTVIFTVSSL
ncbi:MAG: hypothetical protein ACOCRU_00360 [bacterium]